MDRPPLEDLLQPSLQHGQLRRPPYSVRAGFFVAFFGGLLAAVGFAALSSLRTDRVARDAPVLGLLAAAGVALSVWLGYASAAGTLPGFISAFGGEKQGARLFVRALAVAGFGAIYLRQRDMHVTRELRGQDAPSPWGPGIIACVAGAIAQAGFGMSAGRLDNLELRVQVERLLGVERVADARKLLAPAVAQAPDDAEWQFLLARAALIDDDPQGAEQHLRQVMAGEPDHFGARLLLAAVAERDHRYSEAEELLVGLVRDDPDDAELLARYARLMLVTGHLRKPKHGKRSHCGRTRPREALMVIRSAIGGQHAAAERLFPADARDPEAGT